jgi:protein O-GlcNAc transferase
MAAMKLGRNDPCGCGSGKKYKNCCLGKVEFKSLVPTSDNINLLGTLFNAGRYVELESMAHSLLKLIPDSGIVWKLYGLSLQLQGKDALAALQKAADLLPNDAEAHSNLAVVLRDQGQLDAAVASYRRALQIRPNFTEAHNNLGVALRAQGQLEEAVASYRKAVELKPDFYEALNNLGSTLLSLGQLDDAVASYRQALKIKHDFAEVHNNLGIALKDLGQYDAALASFRKALELKPDLAMAHNSLGLTLKELGQHDAALASFRKALELKPDLAIAQDNLLLTLSYTAYQPEYCLEEARKYGQMVAKKVTARFSAWQCEAQPQRLRVGMVSGDLCNSVLGYFMEGMLAHIDPTRIELIAYPTHHKEDELTARIRPHFSFWKPIFNKSDEAAARMIHTDGVHVLLDISGHTANNRLPVFAWKPAPVQASWLGYFATTGLTEMDFILADEVGVPEAQRKQFIETVWLLPDTRLCFTAPQVDLPVVSLPALQNGHITFGCFQILPKVGDDVLTVWGKILSALPDARLRWQCKQLGDPTVANQLALRLQQHGIDPARVTMHGATSREAYMGAHADVDVILDTFPYPGGTTTCEALWMGVPTVTLAGDTLLSRQGASLLNAAGLGDWVASSVEDYIDKATALVNDLTKLAALRAGLRERVSASPLFDTRRFARNFEDALWGMWQAKFQGDSATTSRIVDHVA